MDRTTCIGCGRVVPGSLRRKGGLCMSCRRRIASTPVVRGPFARGVIGKAIFRLSAPLGLVWLAGELVAAPLVGLRHRGLGWWIAWQGLRVAPGAAAAYAAVRVIGGLMDRAG